MPMLIAKALSIDIIKRLSKSTDVLLQALFVEHSDLFKQYDKVFFKALAIVHDDLSR